MLSAGTTVFGAVGGVAGALDWLCCAVSFKVVYPPIGPLKVGEAVTKIIVMLLGVASSDTLVTVDSAVCREVESWTEATEMNDSELDGTLLSESRGVAGAVTCIVVSTVTMLVACEYTVTKFGCTVCASEAAAGDALESSKAGIGRICVDVGSGVGVAAAPVPSCLLCRLWSLTTHLLCSSFARRSTALFLPLSIGPAEVKAARRSKLAKETCIFGLRACIFGSLVVSVVDYLLVVGSGELLVRCFASEPAHVCCQEVTGTEK